MKELNGGCRVYSSQDGQISTHGAWRARSVISRASGAKRITQTMSDFSAGKSPFVINPTAEEVLYVISGEGACNLDGFVYPLHPGAAVFIPPGAAYNIENHGPQPIRIVSACCPEDPQRHIGDQPAKVGRVPADALVSLPMDREGAAPRLLVREQDREDVRAGMDRLFRILVHTDLGCRQITQFVGWIPPGKAPFHYHEYEEGIFILEGNGVVHTEVEECEFGPGSSVYFPQGVRHCVENPGNTTIKLLGAFYPSGSPGAAYEDH
jgi:mannose-6-phosphate isomerase-like protein (cupin superfamily)